MTPDLFSYADTYPNYRHSDPITSKEAGIAARSFTKSDQAEILRALAVRPMAGEEVSDFLGWNDSVRVCRRFAEMIRAGLIERMAERHTNRNGRSAHKHCLKPEAKEAA
jgi:hypothetical protein